MSVGLSGWSVYCGKMADCIRMPFRAVSGVGRGMGVLDGVDVSQRKREVRGVAHIGLNGVFFNRNVFDSCVES